MPSSRWRPVSLSAQETERKIFRSLTWVLDRLAAGKLCGGYISRQWRVADSQPG
jgi:hypothetical protein